MLLDRTRFLLLALLAMAGASVHVSTTRGSAILTQPSGATSLSIEVPISLTWSRSAEADTIAGAGVGGSIQQGLQIPTSGANVWDDGHDTPASQRDAVPAGTEWASWPQINGVDVRHFKATFTLPSQLNPATTGRLRSPYYQPENVPINDNLYVFLNGQLKFTGGTSYNAGGCPAHETDGWCLGGPVPLTDGFQSGLNTIDIVTEERAGWGGMDRLDLIISPPPFKLPYGPYDHVKWSGGPHQYGNTNFSGTFPFGQGSGLDFARDGNVSFPVRAIADGTVEATNTFCPYVQNGPLGYGCWVAIRHGTGGPVSIYAHLEPGSIPWNNGDHLSQGQILAFAGQSGNQPSIHLHLELRKGNSTCNATPITSCGDPLDWDGIVIDGWQIHEYFTDGEGLTSYNYDGSATKGDVTVIPDFPYSDNGTPRVAVGRVGATFHCGTPDPVIGCEKNAQSQPCYSTPTPTPTANGTDCATVTQFATDGGGVLGAGGGNGAPAPGPRLGVADQSAELISTNLPASPGVGGIAEQPDVTLLPSQTSNGSRGHRLWYELAGFVGVLTLVAAGALAMRRSRKVT